MKWYSLSPLILQKLIWVPTRLALSFFGHLEVRGLEHIEKLNTNVIFACNHASELDPFFVPASLPFWSKYSPMFYATREKAFYDESGWRQIFYGGIFFRMWGGYPVFVGLHDYEKSMSHQIRLVNAGASMCVFPEGKTTPDGTLKPAKGGVAYLAERTGRPIIPVAISGTYDTTWGSFIFRKKHMIIDFGAPVYAEEMRSYAASRSTIQDFSHYKEMAGYIMKKIGERLVGERDYGTDPAALLARAD